MKAESCPTHSVRCRFHFTLSYEVALVFCLVFKKYSIAGLISFLIQALESLMSILKMRKNLWDSTFWNISINHFYTKSSTKTYWFFQDLSRWILARTWKVCFGFIPFSLFLISQTEVCARFCVRAYPNTQMTKKLHGVLSWPNRRDFWHFKISLVNTIMKLCIGIFIYNLICKKLTFI